MGKAPPCEIVQAKWTIQGSSRTTRNLKKPGGYHPPKLTGYPTCGATASQALSDSSILLSRSD